MGPKWANIHPKTSSVFSTTPRATRHRTHSKAAHVLHHIRAKGPHKVSGSRLYGKLLIQTSRKCPQCPTLLTRHDWRLPGAWPHRFQQATVDAADDRDSVADKSTSPLLPCIGSAFMGVLPLRLHSFEHHRLREAPTDRSHQEAVNAHGGAMGNCRLEHTFGIRWRVADWEQIVRPNEPEAHHIQEFAEHKRGFHRTSSETVTIGIVSNSKARTV